MTETPTHTPLPYECFQDRSYYDMWCVRRVNEREWGKGFHLVNGEEAAALRDMLNTRADSHHRLVEALRSAIAALEDGTGLDDAICCGGLDCGCRAATHRQLLLHNLTAALKEAGRG